MIQQIIPKTKLRQSHKSYCFPLNLIFSRWKNKIVACWKKLWSGVRVKRTRHIGKKSYKSFWGGGFNKGKHETIDLTILASQLTKPQNNNHKTTVQLNSECGPQGQGHVYRKTMENSCHTWTHVGQLCSVAANRGHRGGETLLPWYFVLIRYKVAFLRRPLSRMGFPTCYIWGPLGRWHCLQTSLLLVWQSEMPLIYVLS